MTVREIWNNCLYTALTISTVIFLCSVGSSIKKIANAINKWNPENVESHVNNVVDHAANRGEVAVNNTVIAINEAVDHAVQESGNLSDHVKDIVRDIVTETAARCGVTFAEMIRMIYDANMGIGAHFVGARLDDDNIRKMVKNIIAELEVEQQHNKCLSKNL